MCGPRVSVLVPVRNEEATLAEALGSVRAQTLADLEVLVVLNGCTDQSAAVARALAREDSRVRVLERPAVGLVDALNHGVAAARAPLVARLDADDRMLPERLARQVEALDRHPGWALVTSGVRHLPAADGTRGDGMARHVAWLNGLTTPEAIRAARFIDAPVAHPAVMFRRAAVAQAGGYRDGPFPEDHELWLRLLEGGAVFGRVPPVLTEWRDRGRRLTRTDPRYGAEAGRALRHRYLLSGPLARGRCCRIWGAGPYGRRHARDLGRRGAPIDDLIDIDPRKRGRRVAGGVVVAGPETVGPPDGRLVLVAVAARGAREEVVAFLEARGHRAERDYLALQ